MPKPPSKHGLERKFKPWRRGMSKKGATTKKSRSSLKNKLRGKERLLAKLSKDDKDYDNRRAELEDSINQLKEEISENMEKERQRKNAVDSHGTRFLERQRLTRMERTIRKHLFDCNEKETFEKELRIVALDQVYVAHYPHDVKYQPLFRKGVRIVDVKKAAHKRAAVRKRILEQLANQRIQTVHWISKEQYNRIPREWSVDMEISVFGLRANDKGATGTSSDDRFALNQQHSALLEAAEILESTLDDDTNEETGVYGGKERTDEDSETKKQPHTESDSDKESSISDSDEDEADPLHRQPSEKPANPSLKGGSNSSSSSSSDSDDSSSICSSSSDDSSDEDAVEKNTNLKRTLPSEHQQADEEEIDDFLVPIREDGDEFNAFETTENQLPAWDQKQGDKSQGWSTQRQQPGQWKKRQRR